MHACYDSMPTFIVFKHTHEVARIRGADPAQLATAVRRLAAEADGPASASAASSSSSTAGFGAAAGAGSAAAGSSGSWRGVAALPRGYTDVTDQVDVRGLDMLNGDSAFGGARALFDAGRPSGLGGGASSGGKAAAAGAAAGRGSRDWVESDTDEQLMLYVPFQATLKIHTLHITSLAGRPGAGGDDDDDDDAPVRPREVRLYVNRAHVLGFEEADGVPATQTVELSASDWDAATGTAAVPLRFVKFQKCSSLVLFVVSGEGDGERVRVDRLRFVGESGEKREMGRLEKVGDEQE